LAEYIALTANRYVGMHDAAPALVAIERMAIDWLREFVGYPEGAEGLLTTGGTLSTLVALVTARTVRLGEDMVGATYYTSEQAHSCIAKSARLAGLPTAGLRLISTDERLRMDPAALAKQVAADRAAGLRPFLVAATAGTTNTGAVDPVPAIADICESEGLWLHVDGAYGGFFRGVPGGHELLPGLERADSLVLDPHKSLFLPYGTGCLLVREPGQLQQAHGSAADYLQDLTSTAHNFAEMSPELTREARGLRVWAAIDFYGADALRDALREKLELAQWLHDELSGVEGIEMGDRPQLSVVSFRFLSVDGDADAFNEALLHKINARRRIFLSSTKINGQFTLRVCLLHFRTNGDEVKAALEEIQAAATT
jgi:aromatic-L-amino-acid decarboxylase